MNYSMKNRNKNRNVRMENGNKNSKFEEKE